LIKVGEKSFKKYIWVVLPVFFALSAFFVYNLSNIRFDYDFEKFFPMSDEETEYFFDYREKFASDNDFVLVAVPNEKGIFDKDFLQRIDFLTRAADSLPYVEVATSITTQEEVFLFSGGGNASKKYIDFDDFQPSRDSARIYKNKELINSFISRDAKSVCVFLKHEDFLAKQKSDSLLQQLNGLVSVLELEDVKIGGRIRGQKYYIDKMTVEMSLFVSLGALLVVVFLFIAFRSIWGVLVPQVVILGALIWLVGGMSSLDQPINIILVTIPSIMFVVSMSDVIHLVSRYLDSLRDGKDKYDAIMQSVNEVGLATLLTSITTAIGFFSLYFVRVEPIQRFGIVIGIGVLIAFVLTFALLPVCFYLFPDPKYIHKTTKDHFWKKYLEKWFIWTTRRRSIVLMVWGVIVAVCIGGGTMLEANNLIMDDLEQTEQIQKDFRYLGEHYGGIRPFELAVSLKDTNDGVWDLDVLNKLDSIEIYLEEQYGTRIRLSLTKAVKVLNRASHVGDTSYYAIPQSKRQLRKLKRPIKIAQQGKFYRTLVDSTETLVRLGGAMDDIGNKEVQVKNDSLMAFLESNGFNEKFNFQITGTAHLLDKNMRYLSSSLIKGLSVSVIIVAFIIGFIYRSWSILVISIITNLIPLVLVAGLMGYLGINLKTSTAIVFTIAFGIAVDDTIHYLGKFKYELMKGKGKLYALKRSYLTTGKAMILTTLILCGGFLLLILSSFQGTFYMGLMLCLTLLVALIADITLLPVLLLLFYKDRTKTE
jgi:predicted RND superfamily exporter protein